MKQRAVDNATRPVAVTSGGTPTPRPTQGNQAADSGGAGSGVYQVANAANASIVQLAWAAMGRASAQEQFVVFACASLAIVGVVVLAVPPYESIKELICFAILAVFLTIAVWRVQSLIAKYGPVLTGPAPPPADEAIPAPPVAAEPALAPVPVDFLRQSLKSKLRLHENIRGVLQMARSTAVSSLKEKQPALEDDQIRANIFAPFLDTSVQPAEVRLSIVPGLSERMENARELDIELKHNEGATGQVFTTGQMRVTRRIGRGSRDWNGRVFLTQENANLLNQDLQWIMSFPLNRRDAIVGVMNIDGLSTQFSEDALNECMGQVSLTAAMIEQVLDQS